MPPEVVKQYKVISTKLPCRGVKDNTTITLNLRRYKNASLFGQKMNFQKPTELKSIKFRILQLQNFME